MGNLEKLVQICVTQYICIYACIADVSGVSIDIGQVECIESKLRRGELNKAASSRRRGLGGCHSGPLGGVRNFSTLLS